MIDAGTLYSMRCMSTHVQCACDMPHVPMFPCMCPCMRVCVYVSMQAAGAPQPAEVAAPQRATPGSAGGRQGLVRINMYC